MRIIERNLPFFIVTAEEQHFNRAAIKLRVSQSALSRRIQILEEEVGATLFERLPRGVRLTPAGTRFLDDVRKLKLSLDEAIDRARNISRETVGALNVGLNAHALQLPKFVKTLANYRKENPGVSVKYRILFSEEQMIAVERGALDVGVLYRLSKQPWAASLSISMGDEMLLAMPKIHPLARKPSLRLRDLSSVEFIWPTRELAPLIYDRMIATCHAGGLSPKIAMEIRSDESIINLVATGLLVGFVNSRERTSASSSVVFKRIEDFSMRLPLCVAWRADNNAPALKVFVSALANAFRKEESRQNSSTA